MNGISALQGHNLPVEVNDLARFILVGREKLQSVRAEIRAIEKLHLAEEVREQKRDEARMLSEALLDAEVRIGELLKRIPKAPGARTDIQPTDSDVARCRPHPPNAQPLKLSGSPPSKQNALKPSPLNRTA